MTCPQPSSSPPAQYRAYNTGGGGGSDAAGEAAARTSERAKIISCRFELVQFAVSALDPEPWLDEELVALQQLLLGLGQPATSLLPADGDGEGSVHGAQDHSHHGSNNSKNLPNPMWEYREGPNDQEQGGEGGGDGARGKGARRQMESVRRSRLSEEDAVTLGGAMRANDATLHTVFLQLTPITAPIGSALGAATGLRSLSLHNVSTVPRQ